MQKIRQNFASTPGARLILATGLILIALLITIITALNQPYSGLGFTLASNTTNELRDTETLSQTNGQINSAAKANVAKTDDPENRVLLTHSQHSGIPVPSTLISLQVGSNPIITLTPDDLIEDPHFLPSYAAMQQLFERQTRLYQQLKQQHVITLALQTTVNAPITYYKVPVSASRPLGSLPFVFWFQLAVSSIGFLLGCWIWSLRPHDIAARVFALLNAMYPVFAFSAAIYSTRDLALGGDLLHALSILNTAGALLYGSALVSLFLVYPKVMVKPAWLWGIPAFFMVWLLADSLYWLPAPSMGGDLPVTLQMLVAIILAIWQWWVNRDNPRARTALRWFAASILVSCGLFVFLVQTSQLLDIDINLSQGYAFGFFLLVTIGIALGLKRYRLFDLDQWAFGILFWLAGAIILVALDAVLIMLLSPVMSLGVALLICGLIWLPLRSVLQRQFFIKKQIKQEDLFQAVLDISFASSGDNRNQQWQQLISHLFQPLDIEEIDNLSPQSQALMPQSSNTVLNQPTIDADGLTLLLPAIGDIPGLRVHYPRQGRGLFSKQDSKLVRHLITLIERAEESRFEYDRGASEERSRIARDLHDDIGSRLLSGLYQPDLQQTKHVIRQSIADMRTIISGMTGAGVALDTTLSSLQQEIDQRLKDSGIMLNWSMALEDDSITLNYQTYKHYTSIMRELLSNVIKHAHASTVSIDITCMNHLLVTTLSDNGSGFDLEQAASSKQSGHGLHNLKQRVQVLQGSIEVQPLSLQDMPVQGLSGQGVSVQDVSVQNLPHGTQLCLRIPLS